MKSTLEVYNFRKVSYPFLRIVIILIRSVPEKLFNHTMTSERLDLDKPLWDANTFVGRWKYFAWMTDFRTCVVPESELIAAKNLCEQYR